MLTTRWPESSPYPHRSPSPNNTHHGGPSYTVGPRPSSKRRRGLKQSDPQPHGPARIIMCAGKVLMPKKFRKIMQSLSSKAESPVTAEECSSREGAPAAVPSPPQDLPWFDDFHGNERTQDGPVA